MSKKTKIILGVLLAVVLGFVAMGFIKSKDKNVARVTTAKVEKIDLISKVTANGKIQARRKVDLSALVMGQIVNLAAKEGDRVQKGQLLLQIDRAQLAAQTAGASRARRMRSDSSRRSPPRTRLATLQRARRNWRRDPLGGRDAEDEVGLRHAHANLSATRQRLQESGANLAASRDSLRDTVARRSRAS